MRVMVNVPDTAWAQLAEYADRHEVSVSDLLAEGLDRVAAERGIDLHSSARRIAERRLRVTDLVRSGLPDVVIAERMGLRVGQVRTIRQDAGLPRNGFRSRATTGRRTEVGSA